MSTTKLNLPELAASQSQKHVTHNQALFLLDQLTQMSVLDKDLNSPPATSTIGDAYIVATGGASDWLAKDGQVAIYDGAGWIFAQPNAGWNVWLVDEATTYLYNGGAWVAASASASTFNGASSSIVTVEEELTGLTGTSVATTIVIPNRCVLQGVSTRTTSDITGAVSYDCGPTGGTVDAYGGALGAAINSTNIGVIGPTAFYSDTTVTLTSNGGAFTGGAVRVALHYLAFTAPSS